MICPPCKNQDHNNCTDKNCPCQHNLVGDERVESLLRKQYKQHIEDVKILKEVITK